MSQHTPVCKDCRPDTAGISWSGVIALCPTHAAALEMVAFVKHMTGRTHHVNLSPGGPHATDCPPCMARALLAKIEKGK